MSNSLHWHCYFTLTVASVGLTSVTISYLSLTSGFSLYQKNTTSSIYCYYITESNKFGLLCDISRIWTSWITGRKLADKPEEKSTALSSRVFALMRQSKPIYIWPHFFFAKSYLLKNDYN
jgi:hypothetical protein